MFIQRFIGRFVGQSKRAGGSSIIGTSNRQFTVSSYVRFAARFVQASL
jgi:hypothetical protein